jgi:hypothetical protein
MSHRWFWAGALLALGSAGCRSSRSYSPPSSDLDASDDASHGPCVCALPGGTVIACSATGCVADRMYLCQGGNLIPIDVCGDAGASLGGDDGGCTPVCTGRRCGDDGCGGTCMCASGLPCDMTTGTCGNGCRLSGGDPCTPDAGASSDPYTCCEDGYECVTNDAGYAGCCATTSTGDAGLATCTQDTDCCDYPSVHCKANHLCQ